MLPVLLSLLLLLLSVLLIAAVIVVLCPFIVSGPCFEELLFRLNFVYVHQHLALQLPHARIQFQQAKPETGKESELQN